MPVSSAVGSRITVHKSLPTKGAALPDRFLHIMAFWVATDAPLSVTNKVRVF